MNLQPKRYRLFASLAAPALAAAVILPVIEAESAQAADVAVLDTGDVRLATKLVDGVLSQDLMVVDSTGAFERFDLESTVISIPNSEPWPGGVSVLSREAWEAWVPDHGPVWRTLSRLNPERGAPVANPLTVSFDTGFIPWSGYALDLELTTVAIGQIQTTGEGRVVVHRGATVMRLANELAIDQKLVSQPGTGVPGGFSDAIAYTGDPDIGVISRNLGQPSSSNGFIFTAPGVYCVTATTETTTAAGKTLRNAAAYTFAVGTDPTEVQACAQPVNIDEPEGPEPGDQIGFTDRVASGVNVALAARLNDGQLALGGYIAGQEATWFDPRATVINIPLRDQQAWPLPELAPQSGFQNEWRMVGEAGEHLFRTNPGMLSQVPEHGNPIEVRPDASFVTAVMVTTNVTFELGTVEGPTGGRLTSFRIPDNGTKSQLGTPTQNSYWNSADRFWNRAVEMPPGNGAYQGAIGAVPNTGSGLGLAFNEPGRYCVTVRASAGWRSTGQVQQAWQTYTFAVGVEPSSVALCAARQDGVVERGDPNEGLTPDVVYLRNGHTDIGTRVVDGALALYVGDETTGSERLADPQDVVIVGNGPLVESTVVNDGEVDTRLMGEPGDTYWIFREDGSTSPWVVWPGLNTMQTGGNAFDRTVDFRILGVDGPGEFVLAGSDAFLKDSPGDIIYASNPDVPRPFSRPLARTHIHLNWLFSEPGRYCVNIEANARGVTGAGSRDTATDLITFVVGDVDLRGIIPCARSGSGAAAVTDPVPAISVAPTPTPIQVNATAGAVPATLFQTALYLDQGNLAVASAYSDSAHSPTVWRDPERFVLTVSGRVLTRIENSLTAGPLRGLVEDDIEMRLGELRGPGWYRFYGTGLSLDSGTGEMAGTLWPGWTMRVSDRFETTGVYCVPVTWSATVAGESQSVSKTLTYVANTAAPGDEGYLDPAGVELCAGQESGPDPGEGDDNGDSNPGEGPEDPAWDVPNGTINAAGVTIVNNGHVDIASRLDNGELVTLIKDDSTGAAAPVYRDPAKTLLQVL
ncbi:MAG: choice-of-anchor M domain-containing protein, partial [Bifidobacteriaceae bacterium]|nr:choice-of-anchor M domain-containing protein [Bifidobacteriaceae bacterium]